ncbi:MAG TPA: PucR family transcriptional regulator ligand-binding domain-containing protein [Conexibacter sp.]|nr:PucR family transcriptional regulator ligand-binding domain-containing protein [Conexibacter sp.]
MPDIPSSAAGNGVRLSVADCLRLDPLASARVVAGASGTDAHAVAWVAVIEWPVEDFVGNDELVLTTGVGCDEQMFVQLAREAADADAAALCVGVGERAPFREVPAGIVALGDERGLPVIALDWEVRFADVTRAVVDRLLSAQYRAAAADPDRLAPQFTDALLHADGVAAIAQALEDMTGRPVVVLDRGFVPIARSRLAAERLGVELERAPALDRERRRALRGALGAEGVHRLGALAELGLPAGFAAPARVHGASAGYVLVPDEEGGVLLSHELQALEQAATAVAIETLRRRAAAEAEARAEGDFLWQLAAGEPGDRRELEGRALLLGYDLDRRYGVLVAAAGASQAPAIVERLYDELAYELRRRGAAAGVRCTRRGGELLVLVPEEAPAALAPAALAQRLKDAVGGDGISWGVARASSSLPELAEAVADARRTIAVGRSLRGEGHVFESEALAPFLMLASLAADPDARRAADAVLQPILDYDASTSRQLLHTLEVYLEEHGNTSSAARRLHLNRHSLLYRVRKIEALTGRDLARHEDRFLFELCLRLERFARA